MILDWTYSTNSPKNTKYTWLLLMEITDGETAMGVYDTAPMPKNSQNILSNADQRMKMRLTMPKYLTSTLNFICLHVPLMPNTFVETPIIFYFYFETIP